MLAAPSRDWNVFKQIFADHWEPFQRAHPRYQTAYYNGLVAKMLECGNPEKMGYIEYRCLQCGQGKHLVAMSCKSSLCLRCAKVYVDNWVSQVSQVLHEGVIYRHIILTVPAMFRTTFYQNAAVVLSAFMRCGMQCLDDFYSAVRGKVLRGGYITGLHTQYRSVARYVAKYVVSPPIAVRRIDRYDGERVTYHYRSHRTDRMEYETVTVDTFLGRMVQHTMPKGFKRIRYYGVQATKTFAKVKVVIQAALAKVEGVVKGAVKIIARLTYRQRYEQSTGRDPFRCPHCQRELEVWRIWHPTYGVIYDEGEVIKRGTYASSAPRAGP